MLRISVVSVVTSPFSFLILLIWALSLFFLMSLAKVLSILFIFSKNQILVSLIFFYCFSISFMISFLLITWGFVCSFSSCFRCNVGCLFEILLVSWGKIVLLWNSFLELLLVCPIGFGSSCFHFHLFLGVFWFPLRFLQWSIGYLVTYGLASMCLCVLQVFFFL